MPLADHRDQWQLAAHNLRALSETPGEPQVVVFDTGEPSDGDGAYESVGHMHALYDTPLQGFVRALDDIEGQAEFLPRLEVSDVICSDREADGYVRVRHGLSFRFLFFRRDYRYVIDMFVEDEVDAFESYRVWWELRDPENGEIVKNSGSWYIARVEVEGRELTYVAYAVHTVFATRQVGLPVALTRFGERDVRNAVNALHDEAQRRLP